MESLSSSTEENAPIISPWSPVLDPKYNRVYYYNKYTRESTWNCPVELQSSIPTQYNLLNDRIFGLDNELSDDTSDYWLECQDTRYKRPYFYNLRTRRSSWSYPNPANIVRKPERKLPYASKGQHIRVKLVRSNPILNGMTGRVIADNNTRIKVEIGGKVLSFAPQNLEFVHDIAEKDTIFSSEYESTKESSLEEEEPSTNHPEIGKTANETGSINSKLGGFEPEKKENEEISQLNNRDVGVNAIEEENEESSHRSIESEPSESKQVSKGSVEKGDNDPPPFFSDKSRFTKLFGSIQRAAVNKEFYMPGVQPEDVKHLLEQAKTIDSKHDPAFEENEKRSSETKTGTDTITELDTDSRFKMLKTLNIDTNTVLEEISGLSQTEAATNPKYVSLMETVSLLKRVDAISSKKAGEGIEPDNENAISELVSEECESQADTASQGEFSKNTKVVDTEKNSKADKQLSEVALKRTDQRLAGPDDGKGYGINVTPEILQQMKLREHLGHESISDNNSKDDAFIATLKRSELFAKQREHSSKW